MKDDLTKLCDKIENCNKCGCHNSEIVCAKYWVGVYINRDRNKFLRLKAEVNSQKNFIDDFVILTPLYNFIDDSYFVKMPALRLLSQRLILSGFRLSVRKWQKLPGYEFLRLRQI